jgi:CMP-N,N'-diacetyllegionaminic acid synthase
MIKVLFVIAARGGSKGVPRKNMRELAGKPLFWHIAQVAREVQADFAFGNIDIVLSSDDNEIIASANSFMPSLAPFVRPSELAQDDSLSIDTVLHALDWMEKTNRKKYTHVGLLQPTSPLTNKSDISDLLTQVMANEGYFNSWTTITASSIHPLKMKRLLKSGEVVNYIDQGFDDMRPRQSLPSVFKRSGAVYITTRALAVTKKSILNDPCFGYEVPASRGVDIDSLHDLELAKLLMEEEKNV